MTNTSGEDKIVHIADHSPAALEHLRALWLAETLTILDEEEMEDYAEEAAMAASDCLAYPSPGSAFLMTSATGLAK